jgi:membrane protein DedA with SNARE-associated domain
MERPELRKGHRVPRNKYVLTASFAVIGLCVIEILEFVELPFEKLLGGVSSSTYFFSLNVISLLTSLGYVSLFVLMLLESASLPIPSEIVLPFAGYLVYSGVMTFSGALIVSTAALMAGALIDYYLGLKIGRPILVGLLKWFRVNPEQARRAEEWVSKRGAWTVFAARFIPGLRSIISVPAGMLRMKLTSFALTTLLGSLGWSVVLIYIGYSAGPLWNMALSSFALLLNQILVFAVMGISIIYILYYFLPLAGFGKGAGNSLR